MLLRQLLAEKARRFIYFGSCGVTAGEGELTPYMRHKKSMESLVLSSRGGLVLRLPQVVGVTENTHTLTNFLRDRILADEHFTVWAHAERNLVDIDDIVAIGATLVAELDESPSIVSIAAKRSLLMPEIVKIVERAVGKSANYSIVEKGSPLTIDTTAISDVSNRLGIDFGDGYIERVIRKYYARQ